jgi:Cu(I)/Ag(I) efflux system membrane fusion protein
MMINAFLIGSIISLSHCNSSNKSVESKIVSVDLHTHVEEDFWTCPMHPQVRKEEAGKCPICGMDLVKTQTLQRSQFETTSESPEKHAPFSLTSQRIQMIGVALGSVEKKPVFKSILAPGRVAFDPELYTAQNEYLESLRQLDRVKDTPVEDVKVSAKRMMESAKLRLKILGLSDRQILELGSLATPTTGTNLLIPGPEDNVWVYADVFEMDLPFVKTGLSVKIEGGALQGEVLTGTVISVDRVINPATRTIKVRVLVKDAKTQLRPESYVDTTILSPMGEELVVPMDAVMDTGKEAWVFIFKGEGQFEPRLVSIKYYAGDEAIIRSGVDADERLVTSANFLLDSESRLKGALRSLLESRAENPSDPEESLPLPLPSAPSCPKGQEWHPQMQHCMPKVGG